MDFISFIKSWAVPNRVSVTDAISDITGYTSAPCSVRRFISGTTFEKVQNEPVSANPILRYEISISGLYSFIHLKYRHHLNS